MADNFLEFSEVIPELTPDEAAWLDHQLRPIALFDGVAYPLDQIPEGRNIERATYTGPRFLQDADDIAVWGEEPDFSFAFQEEFQQGHRTRQLWIYSETSGSVDQAAQLVQKFLQAFRPDDLWTLSYATTCSKPRVGQFGGGVVLVTARRIRWFDAEGIATRALQRHERQSHRSAA